MEKNKNLIVKKETIFNKIKEFFKKLFYKPEIKKDTVINNQKINTGTNKKEDFIYEIKIQEKISYDRLRELQYLIRNNKIDEEQLLEDEKSELRKLYKEQISQIKKSIQDYNSKIVTLKKKIAQNS